MQNGGQDSEAGGKQLNLNVSRTYSAKKGGSKEDGIHASAVIGDTVGDPLKDTSGPSLNILIKLSAIISLVFAKVFDQALLAKYLNEDTKSICAAAAGN